MKQKGTMSLDPCVKILESMRPAIWAFHHNQWLSNQQNDLPGSEDKLCRLAQEQKNPKGKKISGTSPVPLIEKGNPCNQPEQMPPHHYGSMK